MIPDRADHDEAIAVITIAEMRNQSTILPNSPGSLCDCPGLCTLAHGPDVPDNLGIQGPTRYRYVLA